MKKILVADDEKDLLNLIKEGLSFAGYEVECCSSGTEAIEKAKIFQPQLMLVDLTMPDIQGFEVCRRIKEELPIIPPAVIMTCHLCEEDKEKGRASGVCDYLAKPFSFKDVIDKVEKLIGKP